jgi:zinc protease
VTSTRRASVDLATWPRRYELRGSTNREWLGFQLEWLQAQCTDPGWNEDAFVRALKEYLPLAEQRFRSSTGALQAFHGELARRQLEPLPSQVAAVQLLDLQKFFDSQWRNAPITLVIVGDLDIEETLTLVARTFGSLAPRPATPEAVAGPKYSIVASGLHQEHDLEAAEDSSTVGVFAPLAEPDLTTDRPSLRLLSLILAERVRARVREQLGETYAPSVGMYHFSTVLPSVVLWTNLRTAPGHERIVLDSTLREMESVRANGVSDQEVAGVYAVTRNRWAREHATNPGWIQDLAAVHSDPEAPEELRNRETALSRVTAADVKRVAERCLKPESLSTVILRAKK